MVTFPTFRASWRRTSLDAANGRLPLCADDMAATGDESLFDEKGYLVELCSAHASVVISGAVEERACTGEACSGLDVEYKTVNGTKWLSSRGGR